MRVSASEAKLIRPPAPICILFLLPILRECVHEILKADSCEDKGGLRDGADQSMPWVMWQLIIAVPIWHLWRESTLQCG